MEYLDRTRHVRSSTTHNTNITAENRPELIIASHEIGIETHVVHYNLVHIAMIKNVRADLAIREDKMRIVEICLTRGWKLVGEFPRRPNVFVVQLVIEVVVSTILIINLSIRVLNQLTTLFVALLLISAIPRWVRAPHAINVIHEGSIALVRASKPDPVPHALYFEPISPKPFLKFCVIRLTKLYMP